MYWHGVFGGLYLNYLRFAVLREILKAEAALAEADPPFPAFRFIGTSHSDRSGSERKPDSECSVLVTGGEVNWVIDPRTSQVISAGSIEREVDVIDVLARRFEAYHATMREADKGADQSTPASIHDLAEVAPAGWREGFGYDLSRRGCFADRVLTDDIGLDRLASVDYRAELGPESGHWSVHVYEEYLKLSSDCGPWHREKVYKFDKRGRTGEMHYSLSRNDSASFAGTAYVEFNLGLLAGDAPDRYYVLPDGSHRPLSAKFELDGQDEIICVDEWTGVRIHVGVPGSEWLGVYPVKTLSRGEGGLEMTYQGTCTLFRMPIDLKSGEAWNCRAFMRLSVIER